MTLSQADLIRAASTVSVQALERLSVHDVHQLLETEYGALTDAQAYEVLELAANAEVRI